ncbi:MULTISPECIES: hypothetical protein [unclassified Nocardiopsis]|uniref:hypothetical protein n=1 Tax=Nocardiopsis TaxID=2013 RepID=UPI00387B094F
MDTQAWQRLARELAKRRAGLRPEWADRTVFARDNGLSYRSLSDLETGRRDNYKLSWLTKVEAAYRWETGSIQLIIDGADPIPLGEPPAATASPEPAWDEELRGPHPPLREGEELRWRHAGDGLRKVEFSVRGVWAEKRVPADAPWERVVPELRWELMQSMAKATQVLAQSMRPPE